ncbi:MAG: hypothetical protein ABIT04_10870 [Novosphingobium sp.]
MYLSPCIERLFASEHPETPERIRAARAAGFDAVEFHFWRDKDVATIGPVLAETGVQLTGIVVEPRRSLVEWPVVIAMPLELGYDGGIGLEYKPTLPAAESLAKTRAALGL